MLTKEMKSVFISIRNGDRSKISIVFKHYYYFVTEYALRFNNQLGAKEIAEDVLGNAIETYLTDPHYDDKYDLSHFIRDRFINFENKVYPIKAKTQLKGIEKKAYLGNEKALQILFLRNQYIIDDYAQKYYEFYLYNLKLYLLENEYYKFLDEDNYDFEGFISLDDIKQDLYVSIWKKIHQYYCNENNCKYLSVAIHGILRDGNKNYLNYLKQMSKIDYIEGFNSNIPSKISFEEFMEDKIQGKMQYNKTMRKLNRKLNSGCKKALKLYLQGYSAREIGKKMNKSNAYFSYVQKEAQKVLTK